MLLTTTQVALYGADSVDYTSAVATAQAMGIPCANVTGNFNIAATWVARASHMVIAVGGQANRALYWNPCGWVTTAYSMAAYPACTTPFVYYPSNPYSGPIRPGYFASGDGITGLDSLRLAMMLAHYAIYGEFPAGMCCLPATTELTGQTCTRQACQGSPSNDCPKTS
ncbi:MAG: hypothetical protein M0Z53_01375 [Thermaerobacter sp.]|nr:hypothetical protein [Thermaerobacter sp.]